MKQDGGNEDKINSKPFVFLQQVYHDGIDHSMGAGVATNAAVLHQLRSFHSSQLLPPTVEPSSNIEHIYKLSFSFK